MTSPLLSTEAQQPTPSQLKFWAEHKARQARLYNFKPKPANTNVRSLVALEPVEAPAVKPRTRGRQTGWRKPSPPRLYVQQDCHVVAYREWQILVGRFQQAIAKGNTELTLEEIMDAARARRPARAIMDEVLSSFPGITIAQVKGPSRRAIVVRPRQLIMYELYRQRRDLSLPVIGRMLGRDHTTVLHAVRKIEAERARQQDEEKAR